MKVWFENYYSRDYYANKDLKDFGTYIRTRYSNLTDEAKDWACIDDDDDEDAMTTIPYKDIDECLLDTFDFEYCDWFDDYEYEDAVRGLIKEFPHYLVTAYHSNWMGQTGYKFANNMLEALDRSYTTSMYVIGASRGGKSVLINESSHDVPMGSSTIVIGLTEKEFDKLSNSCYNTIIDFADKHCKSVVVF